MLTATAIPRLLKLPVGNWDSSLISRLSSPNSLPNRGQASSGVIPSPSVTGATSNGSGNSSRYRHKFGGRLAIAVGLTATLTAARS
jgi:hypothetical protein